MATTRVTRSKTQNGNDKNDPKGHAHFQENMKKLDELRKKQTVRELSLEEKQQVVKYFQEMAENAKGEIPVDSTESAPDKAPPKPPPEEKDPADNAETAPPKKKRRAHQVSSSEEEGDDESSDEEEVDSDMEAYFDWLIGKKLEGLKGSGEISETQAAQVLDKTKDKDETSSATGEQSATSKNAPAHSDAGDIDSILGRCLGGDDARGQSDLEFMGMFFPKQDGLGEPLGDTIAEVIRRGLSSELDLQTRNALLDKYPKPENGELINVSDVNAAVWDGLDHAPKQRDLGFAILQGYIMKAIIPLAREMENRLKARDEVGAGYLADAFKLMSLTVRQLSMKRLETLKPEIQPRYRTLCNTFTPFNVDLFGEELAKKVNDLDATNKIGKLITKNKPKFKRSKKYSKKKFFKKRVNFLEKKGQFQRKPSQSQGAKPPVPPPNAQKKA